MGVLGAIRWYLAFDDDALGLLDAELGPFDEVGEIGLEEWHRSVKVTTRRRQGKGHVSVVRDRREVSGQLVDDHAALGCSELVGHLERSHAQLIEPVRGTKLGLVHQPVVELSACERARLPARTCPRERG